MGKLFESVLVEEGSVRVKVPKGWRKLVSINGVDADRILSLAMETSPSTYSAELNALLPSVMEMTDAPLGNEVAVVVSDVSCTEELLHIPYTETDKAVAIAALKKNFEGIIALGKAAGLSETELNVVFASSLLEFEKASAAGGVDVQEMMCNMMGGQQCQQQ